MTMFKGLMFVWSILFVTIVPLVIIDQFSWHFAVIGVPTWCLMLYNLFLIVSGKWDDAPEGNYFHKSPSAETRTNDLDQTNNS